MTSVEALNHSIALFRDERWSDLCAFADRWLDSHPTEIEILKLHGVGLATLGRGREAQRVFLRVLELEPKDSVTALNYVTSLLLEGDAQSAISVVQLYFDDMSKELQLRLAEQFQQAVAAGVLDEEDVPPVICDLYEGSFPFRSPRSPEEAGRALLAAASTGNLGEVERAWQDGADLDVCDKEGMTALLLAIRAGHLQVADWLLQYGADPAAQGLSPVTPLEEARRAADPRFARLLDGYFPKIRALESSPFATYDDLIRRCYFAMTGLPARAVRFPEHKVDFGTRSNCVAFGVSRAELAVDVTGMLCEVFHLTAWQERPTDVPRQKQSGQAILLTLQWIALPDLTLIGPIEDTDRERLDRYSRNIDAIARLWFVPLDSLQDLLGQLYYDDVEEPQAIGVLDKAQLAEVVADDFSFGGWARLQDVLAAYGKQ